MSTVSISIQGGRRYPWNSAVPCAENSKHTWVTRYSKSSTTWCASTQRSGHRRLLQRQPPHHGRSNPLTAREAAKRVGRRTFMRASSTSCGTCRHRWHAQHTGAVWSPAGHGDYSSVTWSVSCGPRRVPTRRTL
eukprot:PhF_6_TR17030/c0_g1_i1/m.25861